jgi:site-specific DNA-cytosine methylase
MRQSRQRGLVPNLLNSHIVSCSVEKVDSVLSCFMFLTSGLEKLASSLSRPNGGETSDAATSVASSSPGVDDGSADLTLPELVDSLSDRVASTSGCFYGIGSDHVGQAMITGAVDKFFNTLSERHQYVPEAKPTPIQFKCAWAIEKNRACQAELLADPHGPEHLFDNIDDFLPSFARAWCGLDGHTQWPLAKLRAKLPYVKMLRFGKCLRCKSKSECQLVPTHFHQASAPCIHHSSLGRMEKDDAAGMRFHWQWLALIRTLMIAVVLTENVVSFGDKDYFEFLADIYYIIRVVCNPLDMAFPARRERQIVLLLLKAFLQPLLVDVGCDSETNESVVQLLDLASCVKTIFGRNMAPDFGWRDFLAGGVSENKELAQELNWALARPSVRERRAEPVDMYGDQSGGILNALSLKERSRWAVYHRLWPEEGCDLGQDPVKSAQHTSGRILHCLSKHVSLVVVPNPNGGEPSQWITPSEMFALMGFPISDDMVEACGACCSFSTSFQGASRHSQRTEHSQRSQIGNTIHTTALSTIELLLCIKFPSLGEKLVKAKASSSSSVSTSPRNFNASFSRVRALKRMRSGESGADTPPLTLAAAKCAQCRRQFPQKPVEELCPICRAWCCSLVCARKHADHHV